jgi:hypothetical protein
MRTGLLIIGFLALLAGLVWAAQGAGYFPYPASSFMINQSRWVYIGLVTAAAGCLLIIISRRL